MPFAEQLQRGESVDPAVAVFFAEAVFVVVRIDCRNLVGCGRDNLIKLIPAKFRISRDQKACNCGCKRSRAARSAERAGVVTLRIAVITARIDRPYPVFYRVERERIPDIVAVDIGRWRHNIEIPAEIAVTRPLSVSIKRTDRDHVFVCCITVKRLFCTYILVSVSCSEKYDDS